MRYYAQYNENNKLVAIGTGHVGTEITKTEYNELLTMIREKAVLVDKLYSGEITLEDIPVEWQEEIQRRVDERIDWQDTLEEQELPAEEFYDMLEEVL